MTKKYYIKHLIKDFFIILVSFLILEVFLRHYEPAYLSQYYSDRYTGGFPINLNSAGFRSPEISKEKKANEYRIMTLGDSVTFGVGISEQDTWPMQLRKILQNKTKQDVEIINTAVPAIDLNQIIYAINHSWNEYHPDLYILDVTSNLVSFSYIRKEEPPGMPENDYSKEQQNHSLFKTIKNTLEAIPYHFATYSFVKFSIEKIVYFFGIANFNVNTKTPYGPMLAHGWQQIGLDPNRTAQAWQNFEQNLEKLNETIESHGSHLIIVSSPLRFMLSKNIADNQKFVPYNRITLNPSDELKAISKKLNIPYIDSTSQLLQNRETIRKEQGRNEAMYLINDFTHQNPEGNKAKAEALSQNITIRQENK